MSYCQGGIRIILEGVNRVGVVTHVPALVVLLVGVVHKLAPVPATGRSACVGCPDPTCGTAHAATRVTVSKLRARGLARLKRGTRLDSGLAEAASLRMKSP